MPGSQQGFGSLSPNTFSRGTATVNVIRLVYNSGASGTLDFQISLASGTIPPDGLLGAVGLVLALGSETFAFTPGTTSTQFDFDRGGLSWNDVDTVAVSLAIAAPEPPTALQAAPYGDTAVLLSWTTPATGTPGSYKVEVSEDAGITWADAEDDTGSTDTSWIHEGLPAAATRHYRVSALVSGEASDPSATASATTCAAGVPWCPTLTAGTTIFGGSTFTGFSSTFPSIGSISPASFRHGGSTYTSYQLVHTDLTGSPTLILGFDSAAPAGFILRSGAQVLALASATYSGTNFNYTWSTPPFGPWSNGQVVAFEFAATFTPPNTAPVITTTSPISVPENTTAVTTLTATDADTGTTLTWSKNGGADADAFTLTTGGMLTFTTAPDYENPTDTGSNNSYVVIVQVSDATATADLTLIVNVTDVAENQPPVITTTSRLAVPENTTAVTTLTATDADGDTLIWSKNGGVDAAKFTVTPEGVLTFATAPDFEAPTDAGSNNSYVVVVRVSDRTATADLTLIVNVTDVDEQPDLEPDPEPEPTPPTDTPNKCEYSGQLHAGEWAFYTKAATQRGQESLSIARDEVALVCGHNGDTITVDTETRYCVLGIDPALYEWVEINSCAFVPTPPPPNLRVVQGDLELLVYWDTPGAQPVERFELGILAGAGTWDDSYTAGQGNYRFGNLMNGTTYTVRVRTVFVGGTSGWTTSSPVTLVAASQAPGQVTVDEIRPRPAGADLRFLPVDHATSYVIQWLTEAQWTAEMMQWTSAEEGRQQGQRTFGYPLVGLTPETPYVARIRAENAFGPGPWTEASFTSGRALPPPAPGGGGPSTSPPGAPTNLTAVVGDGQIVLTWDAPASDGGAEITDYEYRINGSGPWIPIGSTDTTHTVTGLVNGTEYTFQVRAVNRIGTGRVPNQAEATPEAPEAFTLDFTHFANGNGTTSDLVFVNVGTQPVRPALYFYDTGGDPMPAESVVDVTGDLEITEDGGLTVLTEMEPLGELTIATHGQGDLVSGSVKVVSYAPIGGMLRFDLPGIGEAVVGASPPVSDALFAVRRQEGGITTGVAIHNLEEDPMEVVCELMQEGVLRDAVSLPLAANGQTAWLIDAAFPAADTSDFAGSVRCDAPGRRRFSAVALEMDPGTRIFLTLPLFPVDRGGGGPEAALDFAHFANGDGTTSDLVFVNVSTERSRPAPTPFHTDIPPIRPALYFYDTEGNPIAAESVVDVTGDLAIQEDGGLTVLTEMEPLGVLTVSTHGQGPLVSGSVRVLSNGPIGGMLRYDLPHIGVAVVEASPPLGDAIFPVRRQEGGITTGVAVHNLESSPALVRCDLLREGVLRDAASFPLEANGQTSWLIDQAFPGTDTSDFVGSVRCDAVGEGRFSAVALEMDPGTRVFTTLPVVPVPERMSQE